MPDRTAAAINAAPLPDPSTDSMVITSLSPYIYDTKGKGRSMQGHGTTVMEDEMNETGEKDRSGGRKGENVYMNEKDEADKGGREGGGGQK